MADTEQKKTRPEFKTATQIRIDHYAKLREWEAKAEQEVIEEVTAEYLTQILLDT